MHVQSPMLVRQRRGGCGGVPKRTPPYGEIGVALAVIALLLLNPFASIAQTVPGAAWATTTPQQAGWSPDLVARANEYADGIGTATLLVVQHGVIVDSLGTTSNRLELHSVRKSLLSALIGIAVGERRIGLDQTLAQLGIDDVPPPLTAEEKQATVQDLLESRSGVYHVALYETDGERLNRPARGSHPPGTFWYYNTWDPNALGAIYEHATGQARAYRTWACRRARSGPMAPRASSSSSTRRMTSSSCTRPMALGYAGGTSATSCG